MQVLLIKELCITTTLIMSHTFGLLLQTVQGRRRLSRRPDKRIRGPGGCRWSLSSLMDGGVILFPENGAKYDWSLQVVE